MADTICWRCKNMYKNKCEWAALDKPVPGWRALMMISYVNGKRIEGYRVISCPKFDRMRRDKSE